MSEAKCPVVHGATHRAMRSNGDWWPQQLNLKILRQNDSRSNPLGESFDYPEVMALVRNGSSPKYSKLRPLRGER